MTDVIFRGDASVPGIRARISSWALRVALRLVSFVGRGDHAGVFTDRIIDVEFAIQEIGTTYYGWPYYHFDESRS